MSVTKPSARRWRVGGAALPICTHNLRQKRSRTTALLNTIAQGPLALLTMLAEYFRCAASRIAAAHRMLPLLFALLALPVGHAVAQTGDPTVTQVVSGEGHTCALTSAGAVKCWGVNDRGQLGSTTNSGNSFPNTIPLAVQTLGSGVVAIAAGYHHTCALTSAGAVKCWGLNFDGQLGSTTNSGTGNPNLIPLDVQTLDSGVVAIAAGQRHTCALTSTGAVKCWGVNHRGQLGSITNSGNLNPNNTPRDVQTLGSGVLAIAAGYAQTCALTSAGAVKCWGLNSHGQLGSTTNSGTGNPNNIPLDVQTLGSGVLAIAAGLQHTCALTSAGAVKCWGRNYDGQLGSTTNSGIDIANNTPLDVQTLGNGVVAVTAGNSHTCALTSAGAAKCWGWNRYGQLGSTTNSGTFNPNNTPLDVQTLGNDVAAITAGVYHNCAMTRVGALKCWGWNRYGQLGSTVNSGTGNPNNSPLDVQSLSNIQPTGQSISFAPPATLMRDTSLTLSATASSGEPVIFDTWTPQTCTVTGNTLTATAGGLCGVRASQPGSASYAAAPQQLRLIAVSDPTVTQVVGDEAHTCALTSAGAVKCWGYNRYGQLGSPTNSGTDSPNNAPLNVQTLDSGVLAITAGQDHTCSLTSAGAVKCWGRNQYGQLGSATNSSTDNPNNAPLDVQTLGSGVVAITAGRFHTCALTTAGAVKCWGDNYYGQLGSTTNVGASNPNNAPIDVQTLGSGVVAITTGEYHTCALTRAGAVKCWGQNRYGQLGNPTNSGSNAPNTIPLDVQTLGSSVLAIAAGTRHTCALTNAGAAKCWGVNILGQLGSTTNSGSIVANNTPLDVQTLSSGVVAITAGTSHSCALTSAGAAKCWGHNYYGQLGSTTNSGTDTANNSPLDVQTLGSGVAAITTGRNHNCVLNRIGAAKCWGYNYYGQLGSSTNWGSGNPNNSPLNVQTLSNIQPAGQSISFTPPATLARSASLTLSASASGGEPVIFDTWTPQTCTIVGTTLTATAGELCGVRASQPGSASYAPAPQQLRLIRILRNDMLTLNVTGQGSVDVAPDPASGGINACTEANSPCAATYADADAVNLEFSASPATGWHVDGWSGDCTEDAADPLLAGLTLDADKTCAVTFAINTYTLTYSAGTNGTISGGSPQTVNHGANGTPVSAVANTGYHFVQWSDGSTANPRTDSDVTADISVTASFAINTYSLTYNASTNGTISGSSPQTVNHGASGTPVSAVPNTGYHFVQWSDGSTANPRTDSNVIANVSVTANFAINTYSVTASAGANGSITPATQTVDHGATASLTVTAASGYHIDSVTGDTCSVSHAAAAIWNTDAITSGCAINATFAADPPDLVLTLDDARDYARYGQLLTYVVTLSNQGTGVANTASISMSLPPELDVDASTWTCFGAGAGASCSATGVGALVDNNVVIPAGRSLTWLVSTPVRPDASGTTIDVSLSASDGVNSISASDSNILVILRNGFDVPYSDGTQGDGVFSDLGLCASEQAQTLGDIFLDLVALPPVHTVFDTLLIARATNGAGLRIDRSNLNGMHLRLVVVAADGLESASAWTSVAPDALLALTTLTVSEGQRSLLLETGSSSISLSLPEDAYSNWQLRTQRTESNCH